MGILLFELFRNPLFMGILNKWETLVSYPLALAHRQTDVERTLCAV